MEQVLVWTNTTNTGHLNREFTNIYSSLGYNKLLWVPANRLVSVSGTATSAIKSGVPVLSLPNAATTKVAAVVTCPQTWKGGSVATRTLFRGGTGGLLYETTFAISSIAIGASLISSSTPQTAFLSEGVTSGLLLESVEKSFGVASSARTLLVEVQRNGSSTGDTATTSLDIVGVEIYKA